MASQRVLTARSLVPLMSLDSQLLRVVPCLPCQRRTLLATVASVRFRWLPGGEQYSGPDENTRVGTGWVQRDGVAWQQRDAVRTTNGRLARNYPHTIQYRDGPTFGCPRPACKRYLPFCFCRFTQSLYSVNSCSASSGFITARTCALVPFRLLELILASINSLFENSTSLCPLFCAFFRY